MFLMIEKTGKKQYHIYFLLFAVEEVGYTPLEIVSVGINPF